MTITRKELVKTAKEFNELMDLDPEIITTKDVSDEELLEKIREAAEMLEEEDEISETAQEVIDYIAEGVETEETAADAPEEEVAEEEASEEQTTEQLVEESDYKALKAMVTEYPEFKGIDIALYPVKKAEELRTRMLKELAKKAAKKAPAAEVKEEKPAAKKDVVKKDAPAKKEGEKKAPKQSGPGVIATIVACIEGAGKKGITKDEILTVLVKTFPDRNAESMKSTINVQVPARISKERFKLESKDGKYFKA